MLTNYMRILALLAVLLLCSLGPICGSSFSQHGLFWGGNAASRAMIDTENTWQDIEDALVQINLASARTVLVNYHIVVESIKSLSAVPLPSENNKDVLQIRVLIDGTPYRHSSAYASTYLTEQRQFNELTGSFTAEIEDTATHNITLQWKKVGNQVDSWRVSPPSLGSGYALAVIADYEQIWSLQENNDVILTAKGSWKDVSQTLEFYLEEDSTIVLGYSMSVSPKLNKFVKDRRQEYISSRFVIDGIAFTEGSETHGTGSWNPTAGTLNGYMSITLTAGVHEVYLQWRRMGEVFAAWTSAPTFLDGFAASRNIFVISTKYDVPVIEDHTRSILVGDNNWHTVNDEIKTFTLSKPSAMLIQYGLPVTQHTNPNLDSRYWSALEEVQTRVMVDNVPYDYSKGGVRSGQGERGNAFASLGLILEAGSHSISLQWRSKDVDWTTLNNVDGGYMHSERLMVLISSENNQPTVTLSGSDAGSGWVVNEDSSLFFQPFQISDVDTQLSSGMPIELNITTQYGYMHFGAAPVLSK